MRNLLNSNVWIADDDKIFRKIKGNIYYGQKLDLGFEDSIENYKEVKLTKANDIEGLLEKDN